VGSTRSRTPADSSPPSSTTDSPAPGADEAAASTTPDAAETTPSAAAPPTAGVVPPSASASELALEVQELRRLTAELASLLDRIVAQEDRLEALQLGSTSELLVLLTSLRSLRLLDAVPPAPSSIDEYIEDMIDPEFGLRPARTTITAAAERILHGYDALRFPSQAPAAAPRRKPDEGAC
jgi:hypothetical protein